MLEIIDIGLDDTIALRVSGKITEPDMKLAFDEMDRKLNDYAIVNLYEEVESFSSVEIAAIKHKISHLINFGMPKIGKIAIVTDTSWLAKAAILEDKIFTKIDIRAFSLSEKKEAVQFLKSGTGE